MSFLVLMLLPFCVSSHFLKPISVKDIQSSKIVNGELAEEGQFPWQVGIIGSSIINRRYFCGGALISDQWVLTAGACVEGGISADIYSGSVDLSSPDVVVSEAVGFILHEYYNPEFLLNNIGLIKLKNALSLNSNTKPIRISYEDLESDVDVVISGWGRISDDDPNLNHEILHYLSMNTINNTYCERFYGYQWANVGVVCTVTENWLRNPCHADSGGPVVLNMDADPVLVGIFSFVSSTGCSDEYPAGSMRISGFQDWITQHTGL